jgi:deoxyribose-phosphate aldolase
MADPKDTAKLALACLDLTSLNDGDTDADIEKLCVRATGPFGHTGAVCVWPRFVTLARTRQPAAVKVAAVANFPDGSVDVERAVHDTQQIVDAGGDEVDVVIPYRDLAAAPALLAAVRRACEGRTLKVILETGELDDAALIRRACVIALDAGADFLKTSTGKVKVNATLESATLLLGAIRDGGHEHVGFKPAGGIRTVADAAAFIALTREYLGDVTPQRFRVGASGLLNDIEAVLGGGNATPAVPSSY